MSLKFLALEIRRVLRSPRFLIFTVAFPVLLFMLYVGIFGKGDKNVIATLMVSMTSFGAMASALFVGSRVAIERKAGWQRQLRLTPLSGAGYLTAKAATGLTLAIAPVVLVPLAGALVEGVSLGAGSWLRVTLGVWLAAIPFALIGLLIGQIGTADSVQPITQLVMLPMALLGGIFIPIDAMPHWLLQISHVLPSYWMGQIGRGAVTTDLSTGLGQAVLWVAVWTVALGIAVVRRYRKDSARV
ncbi:ABC transporter permease [Amycolatopsis thermophila]|uniref:ABC-2 type transport system permease protein n=1 Tax=Amycolatopsis thermophila TaxID=206084 RepID=A0ABU0EMJ1_9PSEU|nr:ABC transporter permease [Amycolatopsis thermophila]MDQ0376298.1 ABC-2 type transport system permease protein [Amycolatopsis thermophila]